MQFQNNLKKYLKNRSENNWQLNTSPIKKRYDFFIIVPAKAEKKNLPFLLASISEQNQKYLANCLVILIINNSNNDSKKIIKNNKETLEYLDTTTFDFELRYVDASTGNNSLPEKKSGVGLARKIGADLAIKYSNPLSIICYTDADVIISSNYLKIISDYYNQSKCGCAIVGFRHQKNENSTINRRIKDYEKFLLKTADDLKNAGSPYGYVTLGSCMTCTAYAYISVGGMNKMKATEDFYFLQELTKHFKYMHTIHDKIVYPSSRISSRVYLGTGYRMQKMATEENVNNLYFSNESFENLNELLLIIKKSYHLNVNELLDKTNDIPKLNRFLEIQGIEKVWNSLINNSDYEKFISQFHRWFDGLKTIQFLKYFS